MIARILLTTAALAVVPAGAQAAATVELDRTCYAPGDTITETGSGFTPNAAVPETLTWLEGSQTLAGPSPLKPITADGRGAFSTTQRAPVLKRARDLQEQVVSTFTDSALGAAAPPFQVKWTLTRWVLLIPEWSDRIANPGRSMRVETVGWTTLTGTLWAHYYRGLTPVRSVAIGRITGDCGDVVKRVTQFPFSGPKKGSWKVFLSNTQVLDKQHDAWFLYKVAVR